MANRYVILWAIILGCLLTGCESRSVSAVPETTPAATTAETSADTETQTEEETTAPPEPYWAENACLVQDGVAQCGVVYGQGLEEQAETLTALLRTYGEIPDPVEASDYQGKGAVWLVMDEEGETAGYSIQSDECGLILRANSYAAMDCAMTVFSDIVKQNAQENTVEIPVSELTVAFFPIAPAPNGKTAADPAQGPFDNLIYTYTDMTRASFENYITYLTANGYTRLDRNQIGENLFASYSCASHSLHTVFTPHNGTLTVIFDPVSAALPAESESWDKVTDTAVTQMYYNYNAGNYGMGYVIVLEDGSFVVIDGGTDESDSKTESEHARLYNLLKKQNRRADRKLVIRAWILTNGRYEHTTLAKRFAAAYGEEVTLERLVCNVMPSDGALTDTEVRGILRQYKQSPQLVILHPGQRMAFCGVQLEAMFTADLLYGGETPSLGDASAVVRLWCSGQSVLFCSDIMQKTAAHLCDMYGSALKCDILQAANHGNTAEGQSIDTAFYDLTDPAVVFWPHSEGCYERDKTAAANAYLLDKLHVAEVHVAQDAAIMLPLPYVPGQDVPVSLTVSAKGS